MEGHFPTPIAWEEEIFQPLVVWTKSFLRAADFHGQKIFKDSLQKWTQFVV